MRNSTDRGNLKGGPVLPFDNPSSGSNSATDLLTVGEAAAFLKISQTSVRRLQQGRRLPFIKVGGSVRFATNDLVAYLAKQRVEALDP